MNTHSTSPVIEPKKEPAPAASSLPSTLSELVEDYPDWENAPQVRISCPHCETTHWHNQMLASIFPDTPCDACADTYKARLDENTYQGTISTTKDFLDAFLPVSLQDTDPDKIPDQSALAKTLAWSPNKHGKGLTLTGPSRSGKTRSLSLLLKTIALDSKKTPQTYFPGEFHTDLIQKLRSEQNYKHWRQSLSRTPFLAIDDLFAEPLTPRTEAAYFEILNSRMNNYMPTFFTTQYTAQQAADLFSSKTRAVAFFNRLQEATTIIPFKPQSAFPLKS